jgi:phosphoglycerol transferase MdoB-like AlkP superfamily enzyme
MDHLGLDLQDIDISLWGSDLILFIGLLLTLFLSVYSMLVVRKEGPERVRKALIYVIVPLLAIFLVVVMLKMLAQIQ